MRQRRNQRPPKKNKENINEEITAPEVRLVGPEGEAIGVLPIKEALTMAGEQELDLVEISANAVPPVCKIIDYGKYIYQQDKKKKEAKKNQKIVHLKEIKMRPKTDVHDYNFKVKHVREFVESGDRVKITIRFRGREMAFQENGRVQLEKVVADTEDIAKVESLPKMEGRQMTMVLVPKK